MYTDTYRFMFLELRSKRCANRCLKARLIVELDSGQLTEEGAVAGPAAYRRTLTRASRLLQRTRKSRAASPSPATERARDLRGAAPDLSLSTVPVRGRDLRSLPWRQVRRLLHRFVDYQQRHSDIQSRFEH